MKLFKNLIVIVALFNSANLLAQESMLGTWQGELTISEELSLTVEFIISDADGNLSVLINSPDNESINNLQASAQTIAGNEITLEFDEISGVYVGELADGLMTGEWTQPGASFPLVMSPYVVSQLSAAEIEIIVGGWFGTLVPPVPGAPKLDVIFTFELDAEGTLAGSINVPAQGANLPLAEFGMVDSLFSFTVPQARARYEGKLEELSMEGTWAQGPNEIALNLTKGEYVPQTVTLLNLSEADRELLLGSWSGQLGPLTIVLRFERDEEGQFVSFVDSPTQGATDLPVTEVSVINNQLKVVLGIGAEFNGELGGSEIVGAWTQGGMTNPLTVSKD